ncbi:C-C motif chemokine 3-like [Poecilia formosa]|uniref:C-C motif chemokine 3-like n=1 Tax=Poecilia formosa TaxID=48698 RepID=UPI0007BAB250|nr:PREDICTED: C-C motif chemokine 3-like [Poecilia formosa]
MQKVFQLRVALMVVLWISLVLPPCHSQDGRVPTDCCFQFFRNRVNRDLISSYYRTDHRCVLRGVVLITRRGRNICVDEKEPWVQNIVEHLEKMSF